MRWHAWVGPALVCGVAGWAGHDVRAVGWSITLPAALAVGAALLWPALSGRRPAGVPAGRLAVAAVVALSAGATLGYGGSSPNRAGVWWLVETAGLLALLTLVVRAEPARWAVPAAGGLLLALGALPTRLGLRMEPPSPAGELAVLCAGWALAGLAAAAGGAALRRLDRHRELAVAEARRAQRLALARHLHDFVAHEVSGMLVRAQAGGVVGERDPRAALAALAEVEEAGQRALASLDHAVLLLGAADGGAPAGAPPFEAGLAELAALVARFHTADDAEVVLEQDPATRAPGLSVAVSGAAYRVVLEALTNVRRHARHVGRVRVVARRRGAELEISVTDDGAGGKGAAGDAAGRPRAGGGTGLAELARQVGALDGTLTAAARVPRGWRVTARFVAAWPT
ncbi:Signal transduction histidine kinase [Streptomyces zhaozhouensis]|uniref:histidine kinase n=1 Tax=Streptomyces zhaozhouensis TaxID=1300267 RepID=A0A286DXL4_9ACTN|nr:ATP-binding protein [Streptomyces zhaozhouensis]SOD63409.1 Signal transduction histidine kinase [Streptomyces zhaozhouensis]